MTKFSNTKTRPYTNIIFSSQPIGKFNTSFYGINYNQAIDESKMRWGFNFNDSSDRSNDAFGGIGSFTNSAGNFEINPNASFLDRPQVELRNRSYAVEWYVREKRI
jgi:hypothetical protein